MRKPVTPVLQQKRTTNPIMREIRATEYVPWCAKRLAMGQMFYCASDSEVPAASHICTKRPIAYLDDDV
jgi:hypothetical protein